MMDEHRGAWEVENVLICVVVTQWLSVQTVSTKISALDTLYCMHVIPQLKRKKVAQVVTSRKPMCFSSSTLVIRPATSRKA